jgi:Flp pilus assembly protein TadD
MRQFVSLCGASLILVLAGCGSSGSTSSSSSTGAGTTARSTPSTAPASTAPASTAGAGGAEEAVRSLITSAHASFASHDYAAVCGDLAKSEAASAPNCAQELAKASASETDEQDAGGPIPKLIALVGKETYIAEVKLFPGGAKAYVVTEVPGTLTQGDVVKEGESWKLTSGEEKPPEESSEGG